MQEGTFWRTRLWERAGGVDTSFRLAGDWDLWRRFAAFSEYITLDTLTAFHRRRPGQLSSALNLYHSKVDQRLASRGHLFRWHREDIHVADLTFGHVAHLPTSGWEYRAEKCSMPNFNNLEGTYCRPKHRDPEGCAAWRHGSAGRILRPHAERRTLNLSSGHSFGG